MMCTERFLSGLHVTLPDVSSTYSATVYSHIECSLACNYYGMHPVFIQRVERIGFMT